MDKTQRTQQTRKPVLTLQQIKQQLDKVSQVLLSRRPLLHIIVLFAADVRVRKYAEEVQEAFVSRGVNCFLQMEMSDHQFIKPENLMETITKSTADYIIVIGDRNMKNRTCHAKRSGKLVEMDVSNLLRFVFITS